ncbi:hypothetical protein OEG86_08820 [Hoeflea alexandrii]|uniref:hypothetical protein n=1 Tax=Hoeflea alexandrii TaxID=288436 RepID=UPI00226D48A5|nr:hypothetical protein [Hoeflea alexandrii]MCY0152326.1 hypothetical protein [Hoeflea alexandrii]
MLSKLVDETIDKLTHSHANNRGKRHRYYVSNRLPNTAGKDGSNSTAVGWSRRGGISGLSHTSALASH